MKNMKMIGLSMEGYQELQSIQEPKESFEVTIRRLIRERNLYLKLLGGHEKK